ncbi:odorant receptor 42a-like isoform X2 [Stomoxys calcitrans]|uniref:odorant receptor 42a-like isoform X2 n=1 Tax=Stomoxys calcitrans TaxID=35570 RepID=UPI0027E2E252|nr:odorant receptor 42a-like isoform X2 [Stomoxys calcitrans]
MYTLSKLSFVQRFRQLILKLSELVFDMANVIENAPQPSTKDCTLYMFRGIKIIGYLSTDKYKILYYLWSIIVNFFVTLYMPVGFLTSFILRLDTYTASGFFTALQIWVNCIGCSLKMLAFFFLYKRLLASTEYMDKLDVRVTATSDKWQIRKIVALSNRALTLYATLYLSYASSTFWSAVIKGKPPYQVYNPLFEWSGNTRNFAFHAAIEYALICFHCLQQALLDSYPIVYITILRTHLNILSRRISSLGNDSTMNNCQRYEALVQCVLDHKNIMGLYNIFSPVISGTMFVQFLIIGIILGITTLHIFLYADALAVVASLFYVASILAETFPCSFLANSLVDDSAALSHAIFHSAWHNEEPRYKQMLCFFLQHSQKTMQLTAMKIFPITLNSNINVVKFAFSVYTMMKQMGFGANLTSGLGIES